jgi:hypothetical protein
LAGGLIKEEEEDNACAPMSKNIQALKKTLFLLRYIWRK